MSANGDSYRVFADKPEGNFSEGALARTHKRIKALWVR